MDCCAFSFAVIFTRLSGNHVRVVVNFVDRCGVFFAEAADVLAVDTTGGFGAGTAHNLSADLQTEQPSCDQSIHVHPVNSDDEKCAILS